MRKNGMTFLCLFFIILVEISTACGLTAGERRVLDSLRSAMFTERLSVELFVLFFVSPEFSGL